MLHFHNHSQPDVLLLQLFPTVEVIVAGKNWDAANAAANKLLAEDHSAFFVHPFDQVLRIIRINDLDISLQKKSIHFSQFQTFYVI